MEESIKQKQVANKIIHSSSLQESIIKGALTRQDYQALTQLFAHYYLMGPMEYSCPLIQLVFPFLKIEQYQQLELIKSFDQRYQTRRLLSGEVYKFRSQFPQIGRKRLQSQRCSNFLIKQLESEFKGKYIQNINQPFKSLEQVNVFYLAKTKCKVLILQLNNQTKQTIFNNKYDRMRLFFEKNFRFLLKDREETNRQLQYFRKQVKKYGDKLQLTNKIYFLQEGSVEVVIDQNPISLELHQGSIIGLQKYLEINTKYSYKVKSPRLIAHSIKTSNLAKLGKDWMTFLQNYAQQQNKFHEEYLKNRISVCQSKKTNQLEDIKNHYYFRKRCMNTQGLQLKLVLQKMYPLQQSLTLNHLFSQNIKKHLSVSEKVSLQKSIPKQRSLTRFNPYKCLSKNEKPSLKRKGFDEYIKISSFTKNHATFFIESSFKKNLQKVHKIHSQKQLKPIKKGSYRRFYNQ